MNRINPIYLVVLLVLILIFLMSKLNFTRDELLSEKSSYQDTLKVVTQLKGLNKIYSNKKSVKNSLNRVLANVSLKAANIKKKVGVSGVTLSSESIDKIALNFLMGKVLNGTYSIYSFKIKRLSDKKASFIMEIKW